MAALTLAVFDIKRLIRQRWLWPVMCGFSLTVACARAAFVNSVAVLVCAWACPFVCLGMTCAVLWSQRTVDRATGLLDGLTACPLSGPALAASRVLTGMFVFGVQMLMFALVLMIRFKM